MYNDKPKGEAIDESGHVLNGLEHEQCGTTGYMT